MFLSANTTVAGLRKLIDIAEVYMKADVSVLILLERIV